MTIWALGVTGWWLAAGVLAFGLEHWLVRAEAPVVRYVLAGSVWDSFGGGR